MKDIKAVLFDCDGLMFDTERISQKMWTDEAALCGVTLPPDFFVRITGGASDEDRAYIHAIPGFDKLFSVRSRRRFDNEYWKQYAPDGLNKPGLTELFAWLNEHGYKIAICSSSRRTYVETLISTVTGGLKYDEIICGDMVKKTKPDPEIFLTAAGKLGIRPENCLVLEDSRQGIFAADAAGMHSCFIQDTIIPDDAMRAKIQNERHDLKEVIDLLEEWNRQC